MSKSPRNYSSLDPLSVGNVVSAALRIYRDRFGVYYKLAFFGYLWVLVPVYGWAKFAAVLGLIARLAYKEVIERPETVEDARREVEPRMWKFLGAGLLTVLIFFAAALAASLVFGIVIGVFGGILSSILGQSGSSVIVILLTTIGVIALLFGYIWMVSRLLIVEVPLAIEDNIGATSAISRSWQLTKGYVLRLIGIVSVAFLITIPISFVVQIASIILQSIVAALFPRGTALFSLVYLVLTLALSFASGAILVPFWQAIKAVIYYDLRTRKEGMGLEIRDNNEW